MKERPILFSAPMVRALLDGSKTQTRRAMKPQPEPVPHRLGDYQWPCNAFQSMVSVSDTRAPGAHGMAGDACPHGAHGDRLRVRETFFAYPGAFARPDAYTAYYDLWEKINGAGSWDTNPWVWVIEFKRVAP